MASGKRHTLMPYLLFKLETIFDLMNHKLPLSTFVLLTCFFSGCIRFSNLDRGTYIQPSKEPTSIPFEWINELIIIETEVNGVKGKFLLDNGFSLSAINLDFAEKAGITFKGSGTSLNDANDQNVQSQETTVDSVKIGEHLFLKTGFYSVNTFKFFPCDTIDGVIGASIINKTNWKVFPKKQEIQICSTPFEMEGQKLPITFSDNNSSFVEVQLNENRFKCKIDMGNTTPLQLKANPSYQHKTAERIGIGSLSAGGLGKADTTWVIIEKQILFVDHQQLPLPSTVLLKRKMKYQGYLGMGYLKQMNFAFNPTKKEMILGSIQDENTEEYYYYGCAIYLVDGKWVIIRINNGDPAIKGIQLFDEVTHINEIPFSEFSNFCSFREYLQPKIKNKESISIRLKGSKNIYKLPYQEAYASSLKKSL